MIIRKLRFQNINSLKGLHEIDFTAEPLASSGIFAITGVTGSGKSTLLDVISLALYNRIPRISGSISRGLIEKTGLILTRNTPEAMAEVSYACHQGQFVSRWSISSTRNNTLRDYEMEIFDQSGRKLDVKKSEVPDQNARLIGLSFDQFVKAILLAQGDFAAFLKARADERGKLLEKITGSDIYRRLGQAAYRKFKECGEELDKLQQLARTKESLLLDKQAREKLIQDIALLDKALEETGIQIERTARQAALKEAILQLAEQIKSQDIELTEKRNQLHVFLETHGVAMEKHRKLLPFREEFWNYQQLSRELKGQQEKLGSLNSGLEAAKAEETLVQRQAAELTRSNRPVAEALEAFRQQWTDIRDKQNQAKTLQQSTSETVLEGLGRLDIQTGNLSAAEIEQLIGRMLADKQQEIKEPGLESVPAGQEQASASLHLLEAQIELLDSLVADVHILQEKTGRLAQTNKEMAEIRQNSQALPSAIQSLEAALSMEELKLSSLEKDRQIRDLAASLSEHRKKLIPDTPCPLCGSLQHPWHDDAVPAPDDALDIHIQKARRDVQQLGRQLTEQKTRLTFNTQQLEKMQQEAGKLQQEATTLHEAIEAKRNQLPEGYRGEEALALKADLKRQKDLINKWLQSIAMESALRELLKKATAWALHTEALQQLTQTLRSLAGGKDGLKLADELSKRYAFNRQSMQRISAEIRELARQHEQNSEKLARHTQRLMQALPEYESVSRAMASLMEDARFSQLQKEQDHLEKMILSMESALEVHRERLAGMQAEDVPESLSELKERHEQLREQHEEKSWLRDERLGIKSVQDSTQKELRALNGQIAAQQQQNQKWVWLKDFIGDAEGKRFSNFAQELTLAQLTRRANQRLELLSGRYQLAVPTTAEDDSLVVIDTHMGDMRRSVKSLSGGESFLVSLALALALSDMAARRVEIQSLFIDEGFGSLDKLTLDQTIDTLEKLQYSSKKTIGVISHVEAMQERITTQIRLEKTGQGHSRLEVV